MNGKKWSVVLALLFVVGAVAQKTSESSPPKTGYVNLDQVLQKTKEGKTIKQKLEKEFNSRRNAMQKRERKLQEDKMKLDSEMSLLSEAEKRKRAQKMQMQFIEFQRDVESNRKELSDYEVRLVSSLMDNMKPLVKKMAKEKKLNKVERITEDVLWVEESLDLTADVIKAYNKKYR